jgi:hypothetical protein
VPDGVTPDDQRLRDEEELLLFNHAIGQMTPEQLALEAIRLQGSFLRFEDHWTGWAEVGNASAMATYMRLALMRLRQLELVEDRYALLTGRRLGPRLPGVQPRPPPPPPPAPPPPPPVTPPDKYRLGEWQFWGGRWWLRRAALRVGGRIVGWTGPTPPGAAPLDASGWGPDVAEWPRDVPQPDRPGWAGP